MKVNIDSLLESRPGVCGGRLVLAGSRMPVSQIAIYFQQGYGAEEIVSTIYPHLELSKVYAALAYYLANRELVDQELSDEAAEYERLRTEQAQSKSTSAR